MEQINESVNIIIQFVDGDKDDNVQMIKLPQLNFKSTRPLYSIKKQHIPLIQTYFEQKNWILLPAYATINAMYLCDRLEFDFKVSKHLSETKAYTIITDLYSSHGNHLEYYQNAIIKQVHMKLKYLLDCHSITNQQYQGMLCCQSNSVDLPSAIFLPDTSVKEVPFQPTIHCRYGPTINIARYLYNFLQPFYRLAANSNTFTNGIDVIRTMDTYVKNGFLHNTTLFATIQVKFLNTILPHEQILKLLERFINEHVPIAQTYAISCDTLLSLIHLILQTQYFVYNHKLYQQTKGCCYGSPLTKLFSNICLFYWQQDLIKCLQEKNEVFGRCFNQMFLTWNESLPEFNSILCSIQTKFPYIPIEVSIGTSILYFDIKIGQNNGVLQSKICRQFFSKPFTLPYASEKPLCQYVTMIRTILIDTIHYCTNLKDFQNEYLSLFSICLFNHYPMDFITKCLHEFFNEFNPSKSNYKYDQSAYHSLRQTILDHTQLPLMPINYKRPCHHGGSSESNIKRMKL